ncbi:Na+/H+ antiporter NhaC family protein [Borrelia sp. A-FGy1]|uniref:Na+/H+ antiporter NhaC family protein n=1 Tax=Borrelia sp. A-FGy1 TaxID=2608247 RepID=UPI0015F597F8|nr:Na+/H+ antiporter NhaC family protein [Borrelia sp. A-FGy1]QMU99392.1 Na+/H+ antiporter NhaC family protein [Borrelia sp. A-FGy1]
MKNFDVNVKLSFLGLLPFIVFVVIYLGTGIYLEFIGIEMAFYQLPASVAMLIASITGFFGFKGKFEDKIHSFVEGASQYDIILMCLIFLLAGAFSTLCKEIGSVESAANIGLKYIGSRWIISGIFLVTCFISFSSGTSVGAIVAIAPIAFEIASKVSINLNLMAAAVMCGSVFGDNLSLISDTTIVSSRTQGSKIIDLFKTSSIYAFPSAILTFFGFYFLSNNLSNIESLFSSSVDLIRVVPYLVIIILSLLGLNVFFVLFMGIVFVSVISIFYENLQFLYVMKKISEGFIGMSDLIFLSMLTGGVSFIVIKNGGFKWILVKLMTLIRGRRSAEFAIALLVSIFDIFLANNTIAILICGRVVKEISVKNKIPSYRSSSLLDIFSCVFQSFIPYGAQMIVLIGIFDGLVSPIGVISFLIYQLFLLIFVILSMFGLDIKNFSWAFTKN